MSPQQVISASCHCGAFNLSLDASELTLPQLDTYCHCTSCRRRTGQLAVLPLTLPATFRPSKEQRAALTAYTTHTKHRGHPGPITTHFCTTCGAKVFSELSGAPFKLSTGLIKGGIDGLVKSVGHSWVGDTKDGGITEMMHSVDAPSYIGDDANSGLFVQDQTRNTSEAKGEALKYLPMHCDCGAFSVYISRPAPKLPLPKDMTWYRPPMAAGTGLPTRYAVVFCGCTTCRTTTGSTLPAQPWVTIPFVDLHVKDKNTGEMKPFLQTVHAPEGAEAPEAGVALGTAIPGLTLYRSSATVTRYHCACCGASVVYLGARGWLGIWTAGLVDDPEGARAESWLSWSTEEEEGRPVGSILWYDDALAHDPTGAQNLKEGLEARGRKVGLRK